MSLKWALQFYRDGLLAAKSPDPEYPIVKITEIRFKGHQPVKLDFAVTRTSGRFEVCGNGQTFVIGTLYPTETGISFMVQNPDIAGMSGEFVKCVDGKYIAHTDETPNA